MTALAALDVARRAWERTQPQLVIDGWADELDSLDVKRAEDGGCCVQRVEPAQPPLVSPQGGLTTATKEI